VTEFSLPVPRPVRTWHGLAGLLLLLMAALTVAPAPAAAASAPTGLRATAVTPARITLSWNVGKAPKYRIQYSTSPSMTDARYRRFSEPRAEIAGLLPGTTYYLRVRAISATGTNLSPYSAAIKARTTASTPAGLRPTAVTPVAISLSWNPVTDAPRYRVQYSTSPSMADATYRRVTDAQAQLTALQPKKTYYLKVRVITADGDNLSPYSPALTVRTTASTPTGLQPTAAAPTAISLSWAAVADAPRYRVKYATDPSMETANYRRVTEPRAQLTGLRPDTTYYLRVRVITADGVGLSPYSEAVEVTTAEAPLRVASYNIRCANCFEGLPDELPWVERRSAVVDAIRDKDLDVVGIQEASQAWLKDANGKVYDLSQFEDLQQRLGAPWQLTNDKRNNCVRHTTPTRCEYQDQGASRGTRILYNGSRVELLSSGSKLLGAKDDGSSPRYLAWAVLRQRSTGIEFFFADSHLEDDKELYELRKTEGELAVQTIKARNSANLPVIAVGDWNSSRFADPSNAPYDAYIKAGFTDPIGNWANATRAVDPTAERTISTWLNSFNGFARHAKGYRSWDNGSYIDYMLTTPMRISEWETVARLDGDDNVVGVIPSDPNMIRMTVYLPR